MANQYLHNKSNPFMTKFLDEDVYTDLFDLIICDPPYPTIKTNGWNQYFIPEALPVMIYNLYKSRSSQENALGRGGIFMLFGNPMCVGSYYQALESIRHDSGLEIHTPNQHLVWQKPFSTKNPQRRYATYHEHILVWGDGFKGEMQDWTNRVSPRMDWIINKSHPHRKPKSMITQFVLNHTNIGDWVLDPFAGSGVVYEVCKELDRNYVGYEIDEEAYCWELV